MHKFTTSIPPELLIQLSIIAIQQIMINYLFLNSMKIQLQNDTFIVVMGTMGTLFPQTNCIYEIQVSISVCCIMRLLLYHAWHTAMGVSFYLNCCHIQVFSVGQAGKSEPISEMHHTPECNIKFYVIPVKI